MFLFVSAHIVHRATLTIINKLQFVNLLRGWRAYDSTDKLNHRDRTEVIWSNSICITFESYFRGNWTLQQEWVKYFRNIINQISNNVYNTLKKRQKNCDFFYSFDSFLLRRYVEFAKVPKFNPYFSNSLSIPIHNNNEPSLNNIYNHLTNGGDSQK